MEIALVDDLAQDRESLKELLKEYAAIHHLAVAFHEYDSAEALLKDYQPLRFTVVFLDVYMDGMSGVEAAEKIRRGDDRVLLVFVTTSQEHVAQAMHFFASSYIMKPCEQKELFRTMDHILRLNTEAVDKRFSFVSERQNYSLPLKEIISLVSTANYLTVHDRSGKEYRTRMTLGAAQELLDERFLLILKGILVNLDEVKEMTDNLCILSDGSRYPINVKKRRELKQIWQNYMFAQARSEWEG